MSDGLYRFDRFLLDPVDRRLSVEGRTVEVSGRYLDALVLLVSEAGRLIPKERFMQEVWRGAPVTDEALTQCVRSLRRALEDDASAPRFIETATRRGYRFIAPVRREARATALEAGPADAVPAPSGRPLEAARSALAGAVGGGAAGVLGGLFYPLLGVVDPLEPGLGATSALTVVTSAALLLGLAAGASVGLGAGLTRAFGREGAWTVVGAAIGGFLIGSVAEIVGSDALALLFGRAPGDVTGGFEGAVLGAAVGAGVWLAGRAERDRAGRRGLALGALTGAMGGLLIALAGGRLLGGSLAMVAERYAESRIRLDGLGGLFGEPGFGPLTLAAVTGVEGLLFTGGVVAALVLADRWRARPEAGPSRPAAD